MQHHEIWKYYQSIGRARAKVPPIFMMCILHLSTVIELAAHAGGSIREPAAFCGVVGLKPTYGRVSRHGLIAYGSSLDTIGPLTHSVADAALLLGVMAGQLFY